MSTEFGENILGISSNISRLCLCQEFLKTQEDTLGIFFENRGRHNFSWERGETMSLTSPLSMLMNYCEQYWKTNCKSEYCCINTIFKR